MTEERKGELLVLLQSAIWSFFPIITLLSVSSIPPITAAGISTLFAGLFFASWVSYRGEWHFLSNAVWKEILLSTLFIGVLFMAFYFTVFHKQPQGALLSLCLHKDFLRS